MEKVVDMYEIEKSVICDNNPSVEITAALLAVIDSLNARLEKLEGVAAPAPMIFAASNIVF